MGRSAASIELSVEERRELEGLPRRRRAAQGLAQRAQIILLAAAGVENKTIAERKAWSRTRSASGGGALPSIGLTGFATNLVRVGLARSAMKRLPKRSA